MTKKEIILSLLKDEKTPLKLTDIVELFYLRMTDSIQLKRDYYIENKIEKSDIEMRTQIGAEFSSTIGRYLTTELITQKVDKKNHYILTENYDHSKDYIAETINGKIIEDKLDKIRKQKEIKIDREIVYQMTCEELHWKCLIIYKDEEYLDYEITNVSEYTYFFDNGHNNNVKIGKTSRTPEDVLKDFKTGNPEINIDIVFPSILYKEKFLHEKFDNSRIDDGREYFFKTKTIKTFIQEHKSKNEKALEWFYKQKDIKDIEKSILKW